MFACVGARARVCVCALCVHAGDVNFQDCIESEISRANATTTDNRGETHLGNGDHVEGNCLEPTGGPGGQHVVDLPGGAGKALQANLEEDGSVGTELRCVIACVLCVFVGVLFCVCVCVCVFAFACARREIHKIPTGIRVGSSYTVSRRSHWVRKGSEPARNRFPTRRRTNLGGEEGKVAGSKSVEFDRHRLAGDKQGATAQLLLLHFHVQVGLDAVEAGTVGLTF